MPFAYRIDLSAQLALATVGGAVTGDDIAGWARDLHGDPDWSPEFAAIWDDRRVTALSVAPEGLDDMVDAQVAGGVGPDLVVTGRPDHQDLMRLYAARVCRRGRPAGVFATLDGALGALGRDRLPASLEGLVPA